MARRNKYIGSSRKNRRQDTVYTQWQQDHAIKINGCEKGIPWQMTMPAYYGTDVQASN